MSRRVSAGCMSTAVGWTGSSDGEGRGRPRARGGLDFGHSSESTHLVLARSYKIMYSMKIVNL